MWSSHENYLSSIDEKSQIISMKIITPPLHAYHENPLFYRHFITIIFIIQLRQMRTLKFPDKIKFLKYPQTTS